MSTTDTANGTPENEPRFCLGCGTPLQGPFCSSCGRPADAPAAVPAAAVGDDDTTSTALAPISPAEPVAPLEDTTAVMPESTPPPPAPPATPTAMAPRPRGPRRGVLIGGAVGLLVAAAAVAAVLLLSGGGDDGASKGTVYRQDLAKAFGPLLGANKQLSEQLGSLRGTKATDARDAVRAAQQATAETSGAVGALTAPEGEAALAANARQVLDRESAYLSAVSSVLANPSDSRRGQLVTLASNLTSAFSAAGPTVAGTEPTVSGADRVTSWAQQTARTLAARKRKTAARKRQEAARRRSQRARSNPTTVPLSGGTSCGGGVYAGPNTSCPFARNVRDAYLSVPGAVATVRVESPVTGQTYTMNCAPSSAGVTCSGGNDASVAF
jgi:hypothetical protein